MGTSKSGFQLAGKLTSFGAGVAGAAGVATGAAALMVKTAAIAELSAVGVRGQRLRNVGKKGRKLGVQYTVRKGPNSTAIVRATGPWPIIESNTKAHNIGEPKGRRGRRRLRVAGQWRTGPLEHPGTRGKHPWGRAAAKSIPMVPKAYDKAISAELLRHF